MSMPPLSFPTWLSITLFVFVIALASVVPWTVRRLQRGKIVNPIAEADVYLAYGRKQQAIDVLKGALSADPDNMELSGKLRELESK